MNRFKLILFHLSYLVYWARSTFFVWLPVFWRIPFWVLFKPNRLQHEVQFVNRKFWTPFIFMKHFCFNHIAWILLENAVLDFLKISKKILKTTNRLTEQPSPRSHLKMRSIMPMQNFGLYGLSILVFFILFKFYF